MFGRLVTMVAVIATAWGTVPAWGQTHPDLSGTWVVQNVVVQRPQQAGRDRPPGGFGGRGGFGRRGGTGGTRSGGTGGRGLLDNSFEHDDRITIKQSDDALIVTNEAAGRMSRYPFDGKEASNPGPGDSKVTSKAHWDGAALVVENTTTLETPQNGDRAGREVKIDGRQLWSLNQEGRLQLESRTKGPRGTTTMTITFARAGQ